MICPDCDRDTDNHSMYLIGFPNRNCAIYQCYQCKTIALFSYAELKRCGESQLRDLIKNE